MGGYLCSGTMCLSLYIFPGESATYNPFCFLDPPPPIFCLSHRLFKLTSDAFIQYTRYSLYTTLPTRPCFLILCKDFYEIGIRYPNGSV